MENLATKIQKTYQLHLDFDDLTGTLDCLYDGDCKSVINFDFDYNIDDVYHDKGDYDTPESVSYDLSCNAYGLEATRIEDDKDIEVSSEIRQIIDSFLENDIRRYIDEHELYND
tara:strand:- start:923 stop:1264 length:342 start_codon:yes stop_codon:yes gene_type:complete